MALPNLLRLIYRNIIVNTDPGSLVILVGLPGMYLVFFGFGFQSLAGGSASGTSYLSFLTPGIMAFQVVMAGTVGGSMLWADRRWGCWPSSSLVRSLASSTCWGSCSPRWPSVWAVPS